MEGGNTYWLISAPKTREDALNTLKKHTEEEQSLSTNFRFHVPDLRVGTLDSLMHLSDDLYKHDAYVETSMRKIAHQLFDLITDKEGDKYKSLTVNNNSIDTYLTFFRWDDARYPIGQNLKTLVEVIHSQVSKLEEELRTKASEYNSISHALGQQERTLGGNLLSKDLSDIIKPNHITESEYLTTLFVAVPRFLYKEWYASYEKLSEFVVPRSGEVVMEDSEYGLFRVAVFKKMAEDFKNAAREKKFTVRDFVYDPEKSGSANRKRLEEEKEKLKKNLIRWCKANFSEAFIGWVHLKAIRIFVESVLRYGLPPNFQAMLLLPNRKQTSKLRACLGKLYAHLSSQKIAAASDIDESGTPGEKFYPYVYLEISLDFRSK